MARVAFNMRPISGPWGGSSVFVRQLGDLLARRGYEVRYDLKRPVDVVVLIDPRRDANKPFGVPEIAAYKRRFAGTRVLHRVNECDQRKGTSFIDDLLAEASGVSDFTVFISEWLRDYHAARWFDQGRPHGVIYNGADPAVFHPVGQESPAAGAVFRLVTHHWSDHERKGFDVYRRVDEMIADGVLNNVELRVIGRWPESIRWRAARVSGPVAGPALAAALRQCHAYLTASRWEPCGMHHVEGAQCGLPLIYHEDGGGIVEAGQRYGVGFRDDVASAIETMRRDYGRYRERLFAQMPSGDRMCADYADQIQRLVCEGRAAARSEAS